MKPSWGSCRRTDTLLNDSLCCPGSPQSGVGFATRSLLRSGPGFDTPYANGLTVCRMRSAYILRGFLFCATSATRLRRRLPGTTGLRFALHGRQRANGPKFAGDPGLGHGGAHGRLHPAAVHRRGGLSNAIRTTDRVEEQQARMPVCGPPLAEHPQQCGGDWHVTVPLLPLPARTCRRRPVL